MFAWMSDASQQLWRNGLVLVPLCLMVALICRWLPCRPSTRHLLWLCVLAGAIVLPFLPAPPMDNMSRAADSAWNRSKSLAGVAANLWAETSPERIVAQRQAARKTQSAMPTPSETVIEQTDAVDFASPFDPPADDDCGCPDERFEILAPFSAWVASGGELNAWGDGADLPPIKTEVVDDEPVPPVDDYFWTTTDADPVQAQEPIELGPFVPATGHADDNDHETYFAASQTDLSQTQDRDGSASASKGERDAAPPPVPLVENASPQDPNADAAAEPAWRRWVAGLAAVRDAVGRLPMLPAPIWIGGIVLLAISYLVGTLRFHYRVRTSTAAPASTRRMVRDVAAAMGLTAEPETHFVDAFVSPLVWRPWMAERPRLVLPRPLWAQLDARGRRAIICHELAHLKRMDHWVHWAQILVGLVYWWHPLVWWVRRNVAEEAEHSCDAWVTWLMPGGRRAYAEALLKTKQFVSEQAVVAPVGGVGMASARTRRFARRITMVMTENKRPGLSTPGVVLAVALALAGWFTMPAWSCPPEEKDAPKAKPTVTPIVVAAPSADDSTFAAHMRSKRGGGVAVAPGAVAVPGIAVTHAATPAAGLTVVPSPPAPPSGLVIAQSPPMPSAAPLPAGLASVGVVPMTGRILSTTPLAVIGAGGDDEDLEDRVEELEDSIKEMKQMLHELLSRDGARGQGRARDAREPRAPRAPRAQRAPRAPQPPRPSQAVADDDGATIERTYKLPEGKLKALTELMVRPDVPVLVRPGETGITVIGTRKQQRIFRAFVEIINPDGDDDEDGDHDHEHDHGMAPRMFDDANARYAEALRGVELDAARHAEAARKAAVEWKHAAEHNKGRMQGMHRAAEALRAQAARAAESAKVREQQIRMLRERARELKDRQREIKRKLKALSKEQDAGDDSVDNRRIELDDRRAALEDEALALATEREQATVEVQALLEQARAMAAEAEAMEEAAERASR